MSYLETDLEADADLRPLRGSQIISKVLSPAIRFWLRSQVESVAVLKFHIDGSDRQILRGYLPSITVSAEQVVYQGLHLSYIKLSAAQIRINLGQVLKGKPLRLLEVVPVTGEANLAQADLNASAASPLLKQALTDLLKMLLPVAAKQMPQLTILQTQPIELDDAQISLQSGHVTLLINATVSDRHRQFILQTTPQLLSQSCLQLAELRLSIASVKQAATILSIQPFSIDLGSEVNLQQLQLEPERIICRGQFNVLPVA